jgi:geranylgeranyl reductase family protein
LKKYDVGIVGAGPAGSSAAQVLTAGGYRVLLVDRMSANCHKVQCAEFVPQLILQKTQARDQDIAQSIRGIKTYINGTLSSLVKAPGYVLNRSSWDAYLVQLAKQQGTDVLPGYQAVAYSEHVLSLVSGVTRKNIQCNRIIGCDGPRSIVSQWLGNDAQPCSLALQVNLLLHNKLDYAEVYFSPEYFGGYAWLFPKGEVANIGIGIHPSGVTRINSLLADFCQNLKNRKIVKDVFPLNRTAGLVPYGGLAHCLAQNNILLAGDAAGCTHPLTGAGIVNAVVSGQLVAETILNHRETGASLATTYAKKLTCLLDAQIAKACHKALERNSHWLADPQKFTELIRSSWNLFPEYYQ